MEILHEMELYPFFALLLFAIICRAMYFPCQSCYQKKWNKNLPKLKCFSYLEIIWDHLKMQNLSLYHICQRKNVPSCIPIFLELHSYYLVNMKGELYFNNISLIPFQFILFCNLLNIFEHNKRISRPSGKSEVSNNISHHYS